eukprot:gene4200-4448_t
MANKLLFTPLAERTAARYNLNFTMNFLEYDAKHRPQTIYCYSPALLPKPADWPDSVHVLGPWLPPGSFIKGDQTISSIGSSTSAPQAAASPHTNLTGPVAGAVAGGQAVDQSPTTLPTELLDFIQAAR